jgi:isocitrate dehydrogenase (NAD+)
MSSSVTFIPGDGVGPEVADAARRCLDATGVSLDWELIKVKGTDPSSLQKALSSIKHNKVALKGPVTTPVGTGFRSVNVFFRQALDLYAGLRPCKGYVGANTLFPGLDLVVVRENTEDLYAGIEFRKGHPKIRQMSPNIRKDAAVSLKPISVFGSTRIVKFAFDYAKKNGRKKVTAVHKANIMKETDGLFLKVARHVAKKYRITFEDRIVDNMCMQLVQKPQMYDVMVLPNLYGDIVSDLCAGLVGGLGVVGGANIGEQYAVFEAVHGSAPKYAGKNKVNPSAMILSGVMLLKHLGEHKKADCLERALARVIKEKKKVTYDFGVKRPVGTRQMADAVINTL